MELVQVGQKITSPSFARGKFETKRDTFGNLVVDPSRPLWVGAGGGPVRWSKTETQPGGWTRRVDHTLDTNAYDLARASRVFVVESARMSGGGYGHGPGDVYPDGWEVIAVCGAEKIRFYQSGCFHHAVTDVSVVPVGPDQPAGRAESHELGYGTQYVYSGGSAIELKALLEDVLSRFGSESVSVSSETGDILIEARHAV